MPESRPEGAAAARAEQAGPNGVSSAKGEPDPLIGRTINGRFKIISVIARGGMGKVYKAEQSPLGRLCALKVLSPKYEGDRDPEFHKRFFLEASTAAKLTHPNTVTIFDYGQDGDDIYYIAMEYIEGRTLHRVLRDEGSFIETRVAHIAAQICRSLREAHALGVVHRDLKPGNILLSDRGDERDNVKVLDFGLVKDVSGEAEDLTQAGLFMGSPKYMAPEQILGGEITARTDIYSLGVMMYEMLTGKVPFDRGASVGTLMAHVNDVPPPMRASNPKLVLSKTMESIVARCLEKDANKRFASMKDLLNALKRVGVDEISGILDTHESMPIARVDLGPASVGPDTMPAAASSISTAPGADTSRNSSQITDSNLGPAPAPPLDTDAMAKMRPKARPYVWFLAAAVAVGIAGVLVATSRPHPADDATSNSSGTLAGTGSPTATNEPATPPATGATTNTAPSDTTTASAAMRIVHVESDPSGASVSEGGTEMCSATPCDVVWKGDAGKGEHKLAINKKGFKTAKLTVSATDTKASSKLDTVPVFVAPRNPQPAETGTGTKRKPNPYGD